MAPPPLRKGAKMFELAEVKSSPERSQNGGGEPPVVHRHVLAGDGTGGYGVCWEDVNMDADLVRDHGD